MRRFCPISALPRCWRCQFTRRERPLIIVGPDGTQQRLHQAMEVLYPGSTTVERRFESPVVELREGDRWEFGPFRATAFAVEHASGATAFAYRVDCEGGSLAYTGDSEWCEGIVEATLTTQPLIAEGYAFERRVKFHLSLADLQRNRERLACRNIVLTHMGPQMLAMIERLPSGYVAAWDGFEMDRRGLGRSLDT